ncbi:MAG: tol-pal system protein YbgF [Rickettsiaceae bacterium]|nr:MAG: tol-pal system protein YbgF [Rickettsiaceae bacterium]
MPSLSFGDEEQIIKSRKLKVHSYDADDYSTSEQQAKEIKELLSRVEVLEYKLSQLNERLEILDSVKHYDQAVEQPIINDKTSSKIDESIEDVFDTPVKNVKINRITIDKEASEVPLKLSKIPSLPVANKEEAKEKKLYQVAKIALDDNKLDIAEKKFIELIQNYPKSPLQSNSYFWYGETFFRRSMFDKAAINYLKGYQHFPKGAKASDSLLKLALALGELKKKDEVCRVLVKLETEFPNRSAVSIKRSKDAKIKFGCK